MIPIKSLTNHVPISAMEVIDDALPVYEMGITKVHIHARDPKTELPTYK